MKKRELDMTLGSYAYDGTKPTNPDDMHDGNIGFHGEGTLFDEVPGEDAPAWGGYDMKITIGDDTLASDDELEYEEDAEEEKRKMMDAMTDEWLKLHDPHS